MNLLAPVTLRALCARAGMRPARAAGQHYLVNAATLARIVAAVDPHSIDTILEVGAGFGVLTTALAPSVRRVIAIERDRHIVPILRERTAPYGNVEVVEGDVLRWLRALGPKGFRAEGLRDDDALKLSSSQALKPPYTLAANLPYGITGDFLRLLFDGIGTGSIPTPDRIVLLLQREVVDRLIGVPGARGLLTIVAHLHGDIRRVADVPPSHFWPPPRVASAIVTFERVRTPAAIAAMLAPFDRAAFLRFVHRAFLNPRRQIATTLRRPDGGVLHGAADALARVGIPVTARPATLTLEEWIALARASAG